MRSYRPEVLLVFSLLLLEGCTMWSEHPVSHWADATGGEGLERSFWTDVKAKNWAELERHFSGNYAEITPDARYERAPAIARLKRFQVEEFSLGDLQTELNGNTFVVTYRLTLRGTYDGHQLPVVPMRVMAVWQHQTSGWMVIAHTMMGPETSDLGGQTFEPRARGTEDLAASSSARPQTAR
jgi:Domain of unknown function (DUF4440)